MELRKLGSGSRALGSLGCRMVACGTRDQAELLWDGPVPTAMHFLFLLCTSLGLGVSGQHEGLSQCPLALAQTPAFLKPNLLREPGCSLGVPEPVTQSRAPSHR